MKIKIDYGNKASISTGVPYENLSPLYHLSVEIETQESDVIGVLEKIKSETHIIKKHIDDMILKDLRDFQHIRLKCRCKPAYINGRLEHDETCLMGTNTKQNN